MVMAIQQLTPKDLADVIGVSESSLRRWVDNGDIRISRTVGGHRRISIPEAIQFIRKIGAPVLRPELLGMQDISQPLLAPSALEHKLLEALTAADRHAARALLVWAYLQGQSFSALCDGPVRAAMPHLAQLW